MVSIGSFIYYIRTRIVIMTTIAPAAPSEPVTIAPADLGPIQELYERGQYMQAYALAEKLGQLKDWTGTEPRILAGRLGGCVGGIKLSFWHFVKAWRADPMDFDACWFYVRSRLETRGPWTALKIVHKIGHLPDAPPVKRPQWLSQHAGILGRLRDFDAADRLIAQAESLGTDHAWIHCEVAGLLTVEDRLEEALAGAPAPWNCGRGIGPACRAPPTCSCNWSGTPSPWNCSPRPASASKSARFGPSWRFCRSS